MNKLCCILNPIMCCNSCGISVCADEKCCKKWTIHEFAWEHIQQPRESLVSICPTTGDRVTHEEPEKQDGVMRFVKI